jgi:hypothetical protein
MAVRCSSFAGRPRTFGEVLRQGASRGGYQTSAAVLALPLRGNLQGRVPGASALHDHL